MKKYSSIISLILLMLISCADEPQPKTQDYPIFTTSVVDIDESGVTLTIDVLNKGRGSIKKFGFLLGKNQTLDFLTNYDVSFEDELDGTFTTKITSNLSPNVTYLATSYIMLEADTVFSNTVDFTSLGSLAPIISNYFPTSGIDGDTITFLGTNFSTSNKDVSISFGGKTANIVSTSIDEIKATVPQGSMGGNTTINITVFDDEVSVGSFVVHSPIIENISPDFGFDGTEVTLMGSFSKVDTYNKVFFNGLAASIIENSANSLKVFSPKTSHTGNTTLKVEINGKESNPVNFVTGPVIQSVSPMEGKYKDVITVDVLGLPNSNQNTILKIGNSPLSNISSDGSTLEFHVPNITSGNRDISIQVGNKVTVFENQFKVNSQWKDGDLFPFTSQYNGESFSLGDKGYIFFGRSCEFGGYSGTGYEYDPILAQWTVAAALAGTNALNSIKRDAPVGFTIGEYIYIGGGRNSNVYINGLPYLYDFYRYNPANSILEPMGILPGRTHSSLSFAAGGKGYIGAGHIGDFYEYDPSSNQWESINNPNVSQSINTEYNVGFSYDDKGYALIYNELWELDPTTTSWTKKADYPGGSQRGMMAFILDGYAYVGAGSRQNSLYKYDFNSDCWSEAESLEIFGAVDYPSSFVLDNTAYVLAYIGNCEIKMFEFRPD